MNTNPKHLLSFLLSIILVISLAVPFGVFAAGDLPEAKFVAASDETFIGDEQPPQAPSAPENSDEPETPETPETSETPEESEIPPTPPEETPGDGQAEEDGEEELMEFVTLAGNTYTVGATTGTYATIALAYAQVVDGNGDTIQIVDSAANYASVALNKSVAIETAPGVTATIINAFAITAPVTIQKNAGSGLTLSGAVTVSRPVNVGGDVLFDNVNFSVNLGAPGATNAGDYDNIKFNQCTFAVATTFNPVAGAFPNTNISFTGNTFSSVALTCSPAAAGAITISGNTASNITCSPTGQTGNISIQNNPISGSIAASPTATANTGSITISGNGSSGAPITTITCQPAANAIEQAATTLAIIISGNYATSITVNPAIAASGTVGATTGAISVTGNILSGAIAVSPTSNATSATTTGDITITGNTATTITSSPTATVATAPAYNKTDVGKISINSNNLTATTGTVITCLPGGKTKDIEIKDNTFGATALAISGSPGLVSETGKITISGNGTAANPILSITVSSTNGTSTQVCATSGDITIQNNFCTGAIAATPGTFNTYGNVTIGGATSPLGNTSTTITSSPGASSTVGAILIQNNNCGTNTITCSPASSVLSGITIDGNTCGAITTTINTSGISIGAVSVTNNKNTGAIGVSPTAIVTSIGNITITDNGAGGTAMTTLAASPACPAGAITITDNKCSTVNANPGGTAGIITITGNTASSITSSPTGQTGKIDILNNPITAGITASPGATATTGNITISGNTGVTTIGASPVTGTPNGASVGDIIITNNTGTGLITATPAANSSAGKITITGNTSLGVTSSPAAGATISGAILIQNNTCGASTITCSPAATIAAGITIDNNTCGAITTLPTANVGSFTITNNTNTGAIAVSPTATGITIGAVDIKDNKNTSSITVSPSAAVTSIGNITITGNGAGGTAMTTLAANPLCPSGTITITDNKCTTIQANPGSTVTVTPGGTVGDITITGNTATTITSSPGAAAIVGEMKISDNDCTAISTAPAAGSSVSSFTFTGNTITITNGTGISVANNLGSAAMTISGNNISTTSSPAAGTSINFANTVASTGELKITGNTLSANAGIAFAASSATVPTYDYGFAKITISGNSLSLNNTGTGIAFPANAANPNAYLNNELSITGNTFTYGTSVAVNVVAVQLARALKNTSGTITVRENLFNGSSATYTATTGVVVVGNNVAYPNGYGQITFTENSFVSPVANVMLMRLLTPVASGTFNIDYNHWGTPYPFFPNVIAPFDSFDLTYWYLDKERTIPNLPAVGGYVVTVHPTNLTADYKTISEGIAAVRTDWTKTSSTGTKGKVIVWASAGADTIYTENIFVYKAIDIVGNNVGTPGSATRKPESVIVGNIMPASNFVTFDGLKFDGITSQATITANDFKITNTVFGNSFSGNATVFSVGLRQDTQSGPQKNITFTNNYLTTDMKSGTLFSLTGGADYGNMIDGIVFTDNKVEFNGGGALNGQGYLFFNNSPAGYPHITNATFARNNISGNQTRVFNVGSIKNYVFEDNYIETGYYAILVQGENGIIRNNTFVAKPRTIASDIGGAHQLLELFSNFFNANPPSPLQPLRNVSVTGNTFYYGHDEVTEPNGIQAIKIIPRGSGEIDGLVIKNNTFISQLSNPADTTNNQVVSYNWPDPNTLTNDLVDVTQNSWKNGKYGGPTPTFAKWSEVQVGNTLSLTNNKILYDHKITYANPDGSLITTFADDPANFDPNVASNLTRALNNRPIDDWTSSATTLSGNGPTPTRAGYSFGGWYELPTLTMRWDGVKTVRSDTTLYAKWHLAGNANPTDMVDYSNNHTNDGTFPSVVLSYDIAFFQGSDTKDTLLQGSTSSIEKFIKDQFAFYLIDPATGVVSPTPAPKEENNSSYQIGAKPTAVLTFTTATGNNYLLNLGTAILVCRPTINQSSNAAISTVTPIPPTISEPLAQLPAGIILTNSAGIPVNMGTANVQLIKSDFLPQDNANPAIMTLVGSFPVSYDVSTIRLGLIDANNGNILLTTPQGATVNVVIPYPVGYNSADDFIVMHLPERADLTDPFDYDDTPNVFSTSSGTITRLPAGMMINIGSFSPFIVAANKNSYVITATAGSGGTITPAGAVAVATGTNRSFSITPNTGMRIKSVTVDGVSVGTVSSYTFSNVTANHTIHVTFETIYVPPTGDNTPLWLLFAAIGVAIVGIGATLFGKKRRQNT